MKKVIWIVIIAILAGVAACMHASEIRSIPLYIDSHKFTIEVADNSELRARGLMFREKVADDGGMILAYTYEDILSIWMKNCKVHLDIVYINKHKQVVDIYHNVPPCKKEPCDSYPTRVAAQYVLELRANRAKEIGLEIGDTVTFILGK